MAEGLVDDDGRAGERRLDVAAAVGAAEQHRVVTERLLEADPRRTHVVGHADALGAVGRRVGGRGHDRRHRLPAEPRLARQRRPRGGPESIAGQLGRQRLGAEVGGADDGDDAVHRLRRFRVEAAHDGVGMRAAHERHVEQAREHEIVHVAPAAAEQPRVLDPFDARAGVTDQDPPFTRGSTSAAISSSCSSPQFSGLSTIQSTPWSSAAMRALMRSATSSAVPSR